MGKRQFHGKKPREHVKSEAVKTSIVEGTISFSTRGDGYVKVALLKEDTYVPAENTATALPGDTVKVATLPRPRRPGMKQEGRVIEVVKRARTQFVGTVVKDQSGIAVIPDNRKIQINFALPKDSPVSKDEKVLVKLGEWKDRRERPLVTLQKVIGRKGGNDVEMESIILERGFESGFPKAVEEEAEQIRARSKQDFENEVGKRRDFRKTTTFTIDPKNAKDFDDALSFKKIDGGYEIGIHIADVSHYVREKSLLDEEAKKRGVSVYLVDRTIPMLPEALSNDLSSLNPNEDKLAFGAVFEMTERGEVKKRWFGKTIIRSVKRFSYEEAQEVIDGKKKEYAEELLTLNRLAKILHEKRFEKGAISFEQDEVVFELDPLGKPLSVRRKERLDTHKLIEEFMLLANREVATFVHSLKKQGQNSNLFVYRIHDLPNVEKMEELAIFLKAIGHEIKIHKGRVTAQDINALFKKIEGQAQEGMIKTAAIRSMAKAIYSTRNIGHFGLGFDYYTHFTSPIRRYPDVLVHRLLEQYLEGKRISEREFIHYEELSSRATEAEIRATEAERESVKLKQVEFMQDKIGKMFDGIIAGVTEWGMYIEEKETKAEGLIKLRDLSDDYYVLDAKNYRLVGERTKKKYSLGDRVRFKIIGADPDRRTLDFALV